MNDDPQRRLVYIMERRELRGHWRHQITSLETLRKVTRRHCQLYDVPPVRVLVQDERGMGASYEEDNGKYTIRVGREYGRNLLTLAHEFAHHVVFIRHGGRPQDHGPTWARVYSHVMHSMKLMPVVGMRHLYRKYGIKYA